MATMAFVIKILGAEGQVITGSTVPIAGQYVADADPDAYGGFGRVLGTRHLDRAMKFRTAAEATAFYQRQSTVRPLRDDGEPNRPMTAFTIAIFPVPGEVAEA